MSNLPISAGQISDAGKSLKQKAREKVSEAQRIVDETKNLKFTSVPTAVESLRGVVDGLTDSVKSLVDSKCKEETGYTLSDLRYKCLEGKRKMDEYVQMSKTEVKKISEKRSKTKELKTKKNKALYKLTEWLKNQSDAIYNGFIMFQIKDTMDGVIASSKTIWDGGTTLLKQNLESLNSIKQIFVTGNGQFTKDTVKETIKSTISITGNTSQDSVEGLLAEMQKSSKTEGGDKAREVVDLADKGMTDTVKTLLTIVTSLLSTLGLVYTLVENYNTNKTSLRDDASKLSDAILKDSAERFGLNNTGDNNPSSDSIDTTNYEDYPAERTYADTSTDVSVNKITPDEEEKEDKYSDVEDVSIRLLAEAADASNPDYDRLLNMKIKTENDTILNDKTQLYVMDFMKYVSNLDDVSVEKFYTPMIDNVGSGKPDVDEDTDRTIPSCEEGSPTGFMLNTPTSDTVYSCDNDETIIFSEIDRVVFELDIKQQYCKLDLNKPLTSQSTKTDGAKMTNLEFSGDIRREMALAILEINNGVRL